jgi:hypothetical protein
MGDNTIELIEKLLESVRIRGFKKTSEILSVYGEENILQKDKFVSHIVENVCRLTNIEINQIIQGKYNRGEHKFAIGLCVYYLYDSYSLNEINRKLFVTKSKNLLSRYKSIVYNLNPKYKSDANRIMIKKQMDEIVKKYILKNNKY